MVHQPISASKESCPVTSDFEGNLPSGLNCIFHVLIPLFAGSLICLFLFACFIVGSVFAQGIIWSSYLFRTIRITNSVLGHSHPANCIFALQSLRGKQMFFVVFFVVVFSLKGFLSAVL